MRKISFESALQKLIKENPKIDIFILEEYLQKLITIKRGKQ